MYLPLVQAHLLIRKYSAKTYMTAYSSDIRDNYLEKSSKRYSMFYIDRVRMQSTGLLTRSVVRDKQARTRGLFC